MNIPSSIESNYLPPLRISCGSEFTIAVNDAGDLFGWGDNRFEKLGMTRYTDIVYRPNKLEALIPNTKVHQVSCGKEFYMYIAVATGDESEEKGALVGVGSNASGQLGVEGGEGPLVIPFPEKVCRVSCGGDFTACISESKKIYTWGRGAYGNLGHGSTESLSAPKLVEALAEFQALSISCGSKHTMALTTDFRVFSWGNGGHGRLGHGDTTGTSTPRLVTDLGSLSIMYICCGESHSAAISTLGQLYTWGAGSYSRLGHGFDQDLHRPTAVTTLQGKRMYMVACGFRHNLALSIHGEVYAWGAGNYGVTGLFDLKSLGVMSVPLQIRHLEGRKITQVAVGPWHSMAISSAGEVFTWGHSGHGRLGFGETIPGNQAFPASLPAQSISGVTGGMRIIERIAHITGTTKLAMRGNNIKDAWRLVQISCGGQHTLALTKAGHIWVWGESRHGALGLGRLDEDQRVPTICSSMNNLMVKSIACGTQHSMAITNKGEVFTWGVGRQGQLGTGHLGISYFPKPVDMLQGKGAIQAALGEDFSAVLTDAGEIYTFGSNESGKLGHGNLTQQIFPKQVGSLLGVTAVSAGVSHMGALVADGSAFLWGNGFHGKLGLGNTENALLPVCVHSKHIRTYKALSCGSYHTLFISSSGELFGCGRKQLLGLNADALAPQLLPGVQDKKVVLVCASEEHSVAITEQGDCLAWGLNKYGKLGNGSETESSDVPVKLELAGNVIQISSKVNHTCTLTAAGEIYTWGCGSAGRLGTDSTHNLLQPTKLATRWTAVQEGSGKVNEEDELNALDLVLSQLETGARITSFRELMLVLQNEDNDSHYEALVGKEADIRKLFDGILSGLTRCREGEERVSSLVTQIENKVLQRSYELGLPPRDYFSVTIPVHIARSLPSIENLIFYLQQQPCYLARLVNAIGRKRSKNLSGLISATRAVFSASSLASLNRQDVLFITLCKSVIADEIAAAKAIDELFATPQSVIVQFLRTFFSRTFGSQLFRRLLAKPISELFSILQSAGPDAFNLKTHNPKDREGVLLSEKIVYVIRATSGFVYSFKAFPGILSFPIKILLRHIMTCMNSKVWLNEIAKERTTNKFEEALLRLLVLQIVIPEMSLPEEEGLAEQVSEEQRHALSVTVEVLRKIVDKSSYPGQKFNSLNTFIGNSHDQIIQAINTCVEVDDSTEVDALISNILSVFEPNETIIHLPVNDILFLYKQLIKLRSAVEIHPGNDQVYLAIQEMGEIGLDMPPTANNYKVNLKVKHNFFYDHKNVFVCEVCKMIMPGNLAIQNSTERTLFKTIPGSHNDGLIIAIETVCRKIPKINAFSMDNLSQSIRKMIEAFITSGNPDYQLLFEMKIADEKIQDALAQEYTMEDFLFDISDRLKDRYSHRNYLRKLADNIHHIDARMTEYLEFLKTKEEDLTEALNNISNFRTALNPTEKEAKKMAFFKLFRTHNKLISKRGINNLPLTVTHNIVGAESVEVLERNFVIQRFEHGFSRNTKKNLSLHYSHHRDNGWHFEVIYQKGNEKDLVGQFNISNKEYIDIKRCANSESTMVVPNVGTFKLGPLMIFLNSRVRNHLY